MASDTAPPCAAEDLRRHTAVPVWAKTGASAAGALGLSRRAAYDLAARGEIPSVRVGGRRLVPVAALLDLLQTVTDEEVVLDRLATKRLLADLEPQ